MLSYSVLCTTMYVSFFFFNDTATTEIYTLSLHDALPISLLSLGDTCLRCLRWDIRVVMDWFGHRWMTGRDRKSTRLNSSHGYISYAVFCLKKKNGASTAARIDGRVTPVGTPARRL